MGTSLAGAREAIAGAIKVTGLNAYPRPGGQITPPCALVEPGEVDFRTALARGHDKWDLYVRVLLGTASAEAAQTARDDFFDRGSPVDIKNAIEDEVSLRDGTKAQDVFVASARKFDAWIYSGVTYLGVEFLVEVYL